MKTPQPILVTELFSPLLDGLISLLTSLSETQWSAPTNCKPWRVKDICLHLLGGDISNLSWKRDNFSVFTEFDSWETLVRLVNDHNHNWVQATQHFSHRLIIELLRFTGDRVNAYFQSLNPFNEGVPVDWVSSDPAPVWLDLAREYTERWHHQQHIRDAANKPGLKEAKFLAPVLDTFILALPRTFEGIEAEPGTSVIIRILGDVEKEWCLVKEAHQWVLFSGGAQASQTNITLEGDLAWRIFTKGIRKEEAMKHIEIQGDQVLAVKLLDTVSIIA
jgi:hypothetical protein